MNNWKTKIYAFFKSASFWGILAVFLCLLCTGCGAISQNSGTRAMMLPIINNCWLCVLFYAAFNTLTSVMNDVFPTIVGPCLTVLTVGTVLYIGVTMGHALTSTVPVDPKKLYFGDAEKNQPGLVQVLFKAMLVAALFQGSDVTGLKYVINTFISPILTMILRVSIEIINSIESANFATREAITMQKIQAIYDPNNTVVTDAILLTADVSKNILVLIYHFFGIIHGGIGVFFSLLSTEGVLLKLLAFGYMAILFVLSVTPPLVFLDALFRIGLVVILSPFVLVSWVFPMTNKYLSSAWNIIFSAFIQFVVVAIFFVVFYSVMEDFSTLYFPGGLSQGVNPSLAKEAEKLSDKFLILIAFMVFMFLLSGKTAEIAGKIGGDRDTSVLNIVSIVKGGIGLTMLAAGAALSFVPGLQGVGAKMAKQGAKMTANYMTEKEGEKKDKDKDKDQDKDKGKGGK